ncbi:triose-phosphate isomerase [Halieaceae bacterium IMCC14734]|uniref:Triosephosphate isomerase n=1 Tax=Candidatus Litorirhabdus singularis TaxID=2518993 RepID=A0ABT3TM00_9GAMM|nr:triose-phosphate isomerase [Candidatus Litorirhabdus singularis]MCX2983044.1 triose-phosphate isomerase [Candidatus Litorirhabdus singularis]
MRRRLVVANWKMHGSLDSAQALLDGLVSCIGDSAVEVAVCPPFVHVPLAVSVTTDSAIGVGGQTCSEYDSGAYTGEVAAAMLADIGCDRVILGHSERRQYFAETNDQVALKAQAVRRAGLVPVLCVGETLEQREQGRAEEVVAEQLQALLAEPLQASDVIAYEPVWAIGTGKTASPEQAQQMHAFIRQFLRQHSAAEAEAIRLLYGGSVKAANAAELFAQQDIDGALVGGASLDATEFAAIIAAAQ